MDDNEAVSSTHPATESHSTGRRYRLLIAGLNDFFQGEEASRSEALADKVSKFVETHGSNPKTFRLALFYFWPESEFPELSSSGQGWPACSSRIRNLWLDAGPGQSLPAGVAHQYLAVLHKGRGHVADWRRLSDDQSEIQTDVLVAILKFLAQERPEVALDLVLNMVKAENFQQCHPRVRHAIADILEAEARAVREHSHETLPTKRPPNPELNRLYDWANHDHQQ